MIANRFFALWFSC